MRTTTRRIISSLLGLTLFTSAGLSQVLGPRRVARSVAVAPSAGEDTGWRTAARRGEPIELSVREDVRELCRDFPLPPEPYALEPSELAANGSEQLEGLAECTRHGPLSGYELEVFGASELPGKQPHATQAAAPADAVRSLLAGSGVPFERIITRDVPIDAQVSEHSAARVVLGAVAPSET
jgi:hypothetical protein